ncbi:sugar transferase [Alphaproteobacteria bacterium]|nr:sugar transferase [Alphaproteobacteria bacterium]
MMKRIFDIIVSLGLLVILLPFLLILGGLIRYNLGSPVFFCQSRAGRYGNPFVIIKFRSMTSPDSLSASELPDKDRLTKFGLWLRASSLDELPSLINVVKGDMSIVGPRPLLLEYVPLYSKEQFSRHNVRPGVTGWAQVNGRNAISWDEKFAFDLWYVDHQCWLLDLKIIAMTIHKVFMQTDISSDGEPTMTKFKGTKS